MIAPKHYAVLADYAAKIRFALLGIFDREAGGHGYPAGFPIQELVEMTLADALLSLPNIWVYSVDGVLHKTSPEVLHIVRGRDEESRTRTTFALFHIDDMKIDLGKLANLSLEFHDPHKFSGYLRDKIRSQTDEIDLSIATRLAALDGFYLTALERELPSVDEIEVFQILKGTPEAMEEALDERQIEGTLRRIVQFGELPRRDEFRREYASHLKIDSFKAIWRAVSKDHPQLSRPGPKPSV